MGWRVKVWNVLFHYQEKRVKCTCGNSRLLFRHPLEWCLNKFLENPSITVHKFLNKFSNKTFKLLEMFSLSMQTPFTSKVKNCFLAREASVTLKIHILILASVQKRSAIKKPFDGCLTSTSGAYSKRNHEKLKSQMNWNMSYCASFSFFMVLLVRHTRI